LQSRLPKEFLSSLDGVKGFDPVAFEKVHADGTRVTSIRLNPAKSVSFSPSSTGSFATDLQSLLDWPDSRIPWSSFGYYLDKRPSFTFDPLFHAGVYYVQEASSMFLEQALRQTADLSRPLRVLDLCAAPGGKSTLLQSLIPDDSLLVSNEVIRTRVNVLQENMVKWGGANVVVTNNDPRDFQRMENYFDVIVVDAPCSGSGLFRREPEAIMEWSPGNVMICHQRQQRILADCWPALRQDGVLIYSTCSYSRQEDEDILDWMTMELGATPMRLQMEADWNIVEAAGSQGGFGYRFYPDKLKGEGFFITAVRKAEGGRFAYPRVRRQSLERLARKEEDRVREWTRQDLPLVFFKHNEFVYSIPEQFVDDLPFLQSSCYLKNAGVLTGQLAAREFIPEHDLALSSIINRSLPAVSLAREEAIKYLRKEEVRTDSTHRGWALVQYEGHNLGWIKILPNRTNNYYPKDWRILKRPDEG